MSRRPGPDQSDGCKKKTRESSWWAAKRRKGIKSLEMQSMPLQRGETRWKPLSG